MPRPSEYWMNRDYAMHWRGDTQVVFDGPVPLTPTEEISMTHHLPATIGPWVDEALDKAAPDEKVFWDMTMAPSPQGITHLLVIWYPGALIGTYNDRMLNIFNAVNGDEEQIKDAVVEAVRELRELRSTELGQANSPSNGHGEIPGGTFPGIILPGQ